MLTPVMIQLGVQFITSATEWNLIIAAGTERVGANLGTDLKVLLPWMEMPTFL